MGTTLPRTSIPTPAQPTRESVPRRLIVTASVVIFAIRDWSLWILLRDGPWGPPMRLVLGSETVTDAVDRTAEVLLMWPTQASLIQLKAGWLEQQVHVWGSSEQGAAVSLIHSILLRANRDELRPNLHTQPVPSLQVGWTPVMEIESGQRRLDPEVRPALEMALHTLRSQVQRDPEIVLRYLADMSNMPPMQTMSDHGIDWRMQDSDVRATIKAHPATPHHSRPYGKDTESVRVIKEPIIGDGVLTLAEATLLYRAFFPADEQIDLSNLRRRFLAINRLEPLDEERPVRGRKLDWRRVSRAYRYQYPDS